MIGKVEGDDYRHRKNVAPAQMKFAECKIVKKVLNKIV